MLQPDATEILQILDGNILKKKQFENKSLYFQLFDHIISLSRQIYRSLRVVRTIIQMIVEQLQFYRG